VNPVSIVTKKPISAAWWPEVISSKIAEIDPSVKPTMAAMKWGLEFLDSNMIQVTKSE
jgi:hypothetical protein